MSHHHGHTHHGDTKNLMVAFLLNLSFTILEIVGGLLTNSVAILSDAVHDLGDTFSLGLAWYFQKLSKKERDDLHTFGYRRYSIIGALVNGTILFLGCIFIFFETIPRLIEPEAVHPKGMLALSIIGIAVNGIAVFRLRKGHSINERVVSLHLLEDVLGWIAVFIGSIVILIWDIRIIDPILSLCITVYILFNIYKNLRSALKVILQQTPENVDLNQIYALLYEQKYISHVDDLRIWSMDGEFNVMTVNITIEDNIDLEEVLELQKKLHSDLEEKNIHHATIELIK